MFLKQVDTFSKTVHQKSLMDLYLASVALAFDKIYKRLLDYNFGSENPELAMFVAPQGVFPNPSHLRQDYSLVSSNCTNALAILTQSILRLILHSSRS